MRSISVLTLFMALCASANAATLHHHHYHHARHQVILPPGVASSFAAVPRSAYAPRPTDPYDDTPSYNDPSKFGGGTALPAE
jgi:hypothetical protein